jgi:hypothetical protein
MPQLNANEMGMIGSGYYGQSQQYQQLLNQPSVHQPNQQYHQPSFHQSTSIDECPRRVCEPITTHTQNYVPSAPILFEIHNTMKSMQAQIAETNRRADEAEAGLRSVREAQAKADGLSRKGKLQADAKKSRLQVSSTHLIQISDAHPFSLRRIWSTVKPVGSLVSAS